MEAHTTAQQRIKEINHEIVDISNSLKPHREQIKAGEKRIESLNRERHKLEVEIAKVTVCKPARETQPRKQKRLLTQTELSRAFRTMPQGEFDKFLERYGM